MMRIRSLSVPKLLKSFLIGATLGTLLVLAAYFLLPKSHLINDDLIDPFEATCLIDVGHSTGTGVVLDTGYILTAGHVVDNYVRNKPKSRIVEVKFFNAFGSISSIHSGRIIYSMNRGGLDFGIVEIEPKVKSRVKLVDTYSKVGADLFTIGCQKGKPPHITYGKKSSDASSVRSRASMTGWFGGSGGGVFIGSTELVGTMVSVGIEGRTARVQAYLHLGDEDKFELHMIQGSTRYFDVIPAWTEYLSSPFIIKELKSKNLLQLVQVPEEDWDFNYPKFLLITLAQVSGVLLCAFYFKRQLLG